MIILVGDDQRARRFYHSVQQLFEDYGGPNCAKQTARRLTGVQLVRNWDLIDEFEGCLHARLWGGAPATTLGTGNRRALFLSVLKRAARTAHDR